MVADIIKGKYRIVREIARSNDIVYEAVDASGGHRFAIKELLLPPNLTGQARRERIERFNREARAAGKLSHPNIVRVFDYGEDNGRYFIAMEYLEGSTLRELMQMRGVLPLAEATDFACQVLDALAHAHAHKVIHRDIKPDNISILQGRHVKLTDFGIARLAEEPSLTGDGQVFGTPSYMSPEQIEGKFVDYRTDLFSLGIVVYEMLAGRKPFIGDSVVSIANSIIHNEPPPLTGVSPGVERVIFRALSKDPNRRYASANEMKEALLHPESAPPAVFFPSSPSGMGAPYPTNYPAPQPYASPPYAPSPYSAPQQPYGSYPPPGTSPAGAGTVYAPPPAGAPPAQPSGGPFVHWGQTGAQPPMMGQPPPPSPIQSYPRPPLIGEGTRTFFKVMFIAVALGLAILGFVVLFFNAYQEQQRKGPQVVASQLISEGNQLFNQNDYEGARVRYQRALEASTDPPAGPVARYNLAVTLKKLGIHAQERYDTRTASACFSQIIDLYRDPATIATAQDRAIVDEAQDYLDRLQMQPIAPGAPRPGSGPGAGPTGNTDQVFQNQITRSQQALSAGMMAYQQGDMKAARDYWQQAVQAAPGSAPAVQAQHMLDSTTADPNF